MNRFELRFEADPALDHVEVLVRAPEESGAAAEILKLLSEAGTETLTVFEENGNLRMIDAADIVSASVDGKLIRLATEDGGFYLKQTMRSFESLLDPERFVRISRYEIVNLAKVRRFDFTLAGTLRLELAGGTETWASRRCIPLIRKRLTGKE